MNELADEFLNAGWGDIDLDDAFNVIDDALDYMSESGYL